MTKINISLLVPCYNAEEYVIPFLKCISKLTMKFDEVLFYDDCSTDNTVALLKIKKQKVIIGKKNTGPAFARNILAKKASFDWFHFHDIDDLLHPNYLEKVAKKQLLIDNDIILCNVDWISCDTSQILIKWRYENLEINKDPVKYTLKNPIGGINGLYRKKTFFKINGFDEDLKNWEDADLHVMLALNGAKFHIVEEVLSVSIRRKHSQSFDQTEAYKYRLICLEKYFNLFNTKNHPVLGCEAEKLLAIFIKNRQPDFLRRAFDLTIKCGIKVPNSNLSKKLSLIFPIKIIWQLRLLHLKFLLR